MNYLILGRPFSYANPSYKGLHRTSPEYIDDKEIISYWDWYVDKDANAIYLNDSDKIRAIELIKAYKKHGYYYAGQMMNSLESQYILCYDTVKQKGFNMQPYKYYIINSEH